MLRGNQVSLREIREGDHPFILRLLNDTAAGFDLKRGAGVPVTAAELKAILTEDVGPNIFRYIALDQQERTLGIWKITLSPKDRRAEVDHRMLPSDRSKGHDADSLRIILDVIFHELNMNRCQTVLFDFEEMALTTFLEAGFRKEATLRHHVFHKGSYHDAHVLAILKDEYPALVQG